MPQKPAPSHNPPGIVKKVTQWFPEVDSQVWILALGRLLSQIGTGFTLFYAPIFFVNQVGLSATAVGIGLGSAQVSGILGRFLGGSLSDAPAWGRRRTLLLSALISAISRGVLAISTNFGTVVLGNLLAGLGIGLYWPATEVVVADLTSGEQRNQAYALTRLGDNIGLQVGIILAGILIATTGAYRALFVVDAISFLVFFAVIYQFISESGQSTTTEMEAIDPDQNAAPAATISQSWRKALSDRVLLIYVGVNIIFTLYISQIHATIPLYFSNGLNPGFSSQVLSGLFTWHVAVSVIALLPLAKVLSRLSHAQILMVSAIFWGVGFGCIGLMGILGGRSLAFAILSLAILALATVSYAPAASSLVADLAPASLRGVYLAINAQCWAIGYLMGPPLGGWVLDQSPQMADQFWFYLAASVIVVIGILQVLDRMIKDRQFVEQKGNLWESKQN
ncbi:MAG: MDR family MFS transporter [Microcoleaceae cyanobacterium]